MIRQSCPPLLSRSRLAAACLALGGAGHAGSLFLAGTPEIVAGHYGNNDPLSEAWGLETGASQANVTSGPGPAGAWQVSDDSASDGSWRWYSYPLALCNAGELDDVGWTLRVCARVGALSTGNDDEPGILASYNTGSRRYDIWLRPDGSGGVIVHLMTANPLGCGLSATTHQVSGPGNCQEPGFHLYELVFDPVMGNADLVVDGLLAVDDYAGHSLGLANFSDVIWGAGGSCTKGSAEFALVELEAHADVTGPASSSQTTRVGSPANPDVFLAGVSSGPAIGATWDPVIDHTGFLPSATLDLLAVTLSATNVALPPYGTLLCLPPVLGSFFTSAAGEPFSVPVPANCSFVGLSLCSQGLSLDAAGTALLTNALDITIGTY